MSERKTRKTRVNAKRPPSPRPPVAKPKANVRVSSKKGKRPTRRRPAPAKGTLEAHTAGRRGPKASTPKPAKPTKAPAAKPGDVPPKGAKRPRPSRLGAGKTLLGRPRPPRRPASPRGASQIAKALSAMVTLARKAWIDLSPKAKTGATAGAAAAARLGRSAARGVAQGGATAARFAAEHRKAALRVLHRVAWWGSWVILLLAGRDLVAFEPVGRFPVEQSTFLWGLGLCAFVVATAAERRLRTGALALGGAHALAAAILIAG